MAAMACAGAVGAATAVQWGASSSGSCCGVGASRSVAFRGAAVAVKPLRVCRRGRQEDGVEFLQSAMGRLSVKASAEDGEGEGDLTVNKPKGSGKKVIGVVNSVALGVEKALLILGTRIVVFCFSIVVYFLLWYGMFVVLQ